jgi:hypothetical protein
MRVCNLVHTALTLFLLANNYHVGAFTTTTTSSLTTRFINSNCFYSSVLFSTVTDGEKVGSSTAAGVPPATSEASGNIEDAEIPTNLPSACGMDYVPLATMLATGQLAEADQVRGLINFIFEK